MKLLAVVVLSASLVQACAGPLARGSGAPAPVSENVNAPAKPHRWVWWVAGGTLLAAAATGLFYVMIEGAAENAARAAVPSFDSSADRRGGGVRTVAFGAAR